MPIKVDLRKMPYNLSDADVQWVESTLVGMTLKEKIGQLFFQLFMDFSEDAVKNLLKQIPLGGARYHTKSAKEVQDLVTNLNKYSRLPMFIACNCDNGGDGACSDGTYIASGAQCEACNDPTVAYHAGLVSGREAVAIGCNWNFNPCSDILFNWRNTIVNTRAYGTNADTVLKNIQAYVNGLTESNILSTIKHFPGDGSEERDQHLVLGVNELSVENWDRSYGKVFKTMIDNGLDTIMAGHIALPNYSKHLNPCLTYNDIMPATLAPELINGLLKTQLNFNGLVITDASHMLGMFAAMPRKDQLPRAIASGCDMFLFLNDVEEDFQYMMDGYLNKIITKERLEDAVRRILGLKAKLGLNKVARSELNPKREALSIIGCPEHLQMRSQAADLGITLVKNTLNQLPITPDKYPRVMLYVLANEEIGVYDNMNSKTANLIKQALEKVGFKVTINKRGVREKGSVEAYKKNYDCAMIFSDIRGYAAENNYRIRWSAAMANEIPWMVWEVPTVFVSLNQTTHLTDVPMVKTFINAYHNNEETIRQVIDKIIGKSEFKGTPNENVWCNLWETRR
ncbi:glycoside hydrolase family 3 protein [[Mycoplasma] testudinis]|uniref:glycoside hydrolase family 3 protein n=1 Tax=[Mycoplasma] testudinis TaxID=33924 RepID=UPI0004880FC8|nr:glycoside hydrolase family 3 N-terminal domain-containing protein [[Mycoplasma] testudinis]